MCSISELYNIVNISDGISKFSSPCVCRVTEDSYAVTTSPTSVALFKEYEHVPSKTWFSKATQPFSCSVVYDDNTSKFYGASGVKLLGWALDSESCETLVDSFPSEILTLCVVSEFGCLVCFINGSCYVVSKRQSLPRFQAVLYHEKFCWADCGQVDSQNRLKVYFLSHDKRSVGVKFIKAENVISENVISLDVQPLAWALHANEFAALQKPGRLCMFNNQGETSSEIEVKISGSNFALCSVDSNHSAVVSDDTVSLLNVSFGLENVSKAHSNPPASSWATVLDGKLYFVSGTSLMSAKITIPRTNLSTLVGVHRVSNKALLKEKRQTLKLVPCNNAADIVFASIDKMSVQQMNKALDELRDVPEKYLVLVLRRLMQISKDSSTFSPAETDIVHRIMAIPHDFRELKQRLAVHLTAAESMRLIRFVSDVAASFSVQMEKIVPINRALSWMEALVESHGSALAMSADSKKTMKKVAKTLQLLELICAEMDQIEPYIAFMTKKIPKPEIDQTKRLHVVERWIV